jgi:hypothetical protein
MRLFSILFVAAGFACQEPMAARVGQEFTLTQGEQVRIADANLTIAFNDVPSDSRCPINAMCIWAGNAVVVLGVHLGPPDARPPDLQVTLNTFLDPRAAPVDGYELQLIRLTPEPVAGEPQVKPYRATLRLVPVAP